ncbi:MAG: glycosyltransferase [Gammaproteobacteria bacterium]|nr:glycosyltransferase [Gammaproteobacteria bacterium]
MTRRDEYSSGAKLHLAGQDAYLDHVVIMIVQLNWGGLPRVLFTLADEFVKRGVRVDLAVCEPGGTRVEAVPAGVRVFQLQRSSNLATRLTALRADLSGWRVMLKPVLLASKPPGYMIYMRSFVEYLRAEQPHVILSASRTLNVMAPWARKLARSHARVVLSEHTPPTPDLSDSAKWGRRFLPPLMARNYAMADAIVAVSHGVADDLARLTGLPLERIKRSTIL